MTIRGSFGSALMLSIWFFLISALSAIGAFVGRPVWLHSLVSASIGLLLVAWVATVRVTVTESTLEISGLFRRHRRIALRDIAEVRLDAAGSRYSDRFGPAFRLQIIPRDGAPVGSVSVNAKLFKRADLSALLRRIEESRSRG